MRYTVHGHSVQQQQLQISREITLGARIVVVCFRMVKFGHLPAFKFDHLHLLASRQESKNAPPA